VVWTVHDPWLITGHCVYPLDCEGWKEGCPSCPHLDYPKKVYLDRSAFMLRMKRRIIQRSNVHLVVASEHMRKMLSESSVTAGKQVTVIPFGIDVARFEGVDRQEARRSLGVGDEVVIAFRSVPGPFKGVTYVLKALSELDPRMPVTIITFGKKGLLHELPKGARHLEFEWVTDEEMLRILRATDIFIMPSMAEAFGLMAIESMAAGVPVVAFRGTALEEVIDDGRTGLLVDRGDVEGLRLAMARLIGDAPLRERRGREASTAVKERYDRSRYAGDTAELYRRVMEDQRR